MHSPFGCRTALPCMGQTTAVMGDHCFLCSRACGMHSLWARPGWAFKHLGLRHACMRFACCNLAARCPPMQVGVTFKAQEQEASRGSDSLYEQQHNGPRSNGSASARCTVQITVRACRVGCSGVGAESRRRRMGWATRRTCLPGSALAHLAHGHSRLVHAAARHLHPLCVLAAMR